MKFVCKYRYVIDKMPLIDVDDVVSECCIGFNRAIERYDPERGTRFTTISMWWLKQAMMRCIE